MKIQCVNLTAIRLNCGNHIIRGRKNDFVVLWSLNKTTERFTNDELAEYFDLTQEQIDKIVWTFNHYN